MPVPLRAVPAARGSAQLDHHTAAFVAAACAGMGGRQVGKDVFRDFMAHMNRSYRETLTGIEIFANADGTRAAAEFVVNGEYLKTDPGLPEARGQRYVLPAGTFFALKDGKITRVTTYYNLNDWIAQVSA